MFPWLRKPIWTRKTRWTPLLQNQREFQRSISKERARVDRNGNSFGFIILRLESAHQVRPNTVKLGKLLHRRLRETDEKGHLGPRRVGVVLPETERQQTSFVMSELLRLAREQNLAVSGECFVYPDDKGYGERPSEHRDLRPRVEELVEREVVEPLAIQSAAVSPMAVATSPTTNAVSSLLPEYPLWKRAIDVAGSAFGLLATAPCLALAAIAIRSTSKGPILFRQVRTGYLGRPFVIYKLRTMVVNAEELKATLAKDNERDGPAFKMRRDPRITRVGRLLRATGVDELPQLYNVLIGDMSLVGPRPLPVDEAAECTGWRECRQDIRPGLTCTWQISKSRQVSFAEWMRMDIRYSRRCSLGTDLKLMLRTVSSLMMGRAGH